MKALLVNDIIIRIVQTGGVEIGAIPKGVGLERLRFDGTQVIDLADLNQIWVEQKNNQFVLHVVDTGNCQLVTMTHADRKNLVNDGGTYRLKTETELLEEGIAQRNLLRKNRLRARLLRKIGDNHDQTADLGKLVIAMLGYRTSQNPQLGAMLDAVANIAKDIYTLDQIEAAVRRFAQTLKDEMPGYYDELE